MSCIRASSSATSTRMSRCMGGCFVAAMNFARWYDVSAIRVAGVGGAMARVAESAAAGRRVREGGHGVTSSGARNALVWRDELDIADLVGQAVVRHRLEGDHRVQVVRVARPLEQVDGREAA